MTRNVVLVDRLPKRKLGKGGRAMSVELEADRIDDLLIWIDNLNPSKRHGTSGDCIVERFESRRGRRLELADDSTLRTLLANGLKDASTASIAMGEDGVLAIVVGFTDSTPVFPDRLDRVSNVGRILVRLVRLSLGMEADRSLDPIPNGDRADGLEVPDANLCPICAEVLEDDFGEGDVPAAGMLNRLNVPRSIWRLNSIGWIQSSETLRRALDDRLDHLWRRNHRVLTRIRDMKVDEDRSTERQHFAVAFRYWRACALGLSVAVFLPLMVSGIPLGKEPLSFTAETLTYFSLSAFVLGLVPRMCIPRHGLSQHIHRTNVLHMRCCVLAIIAILASAWFLMTFAPQDNFPSIQPDGNTAYFFEAGLRVVWLLPLLSISLVFWKWTELREQLDEIGLSTKPQIKLLDSYEKAIRRNDPSQAEAAVAARIANQVSPVRAHVEARTAQFLHSKAMRDRGYALIAASITFLGPLNAMKPEFRKPPADPPPTMTGPFISVGDVRLAPTVRMNLTAPPPPATPAAPSVSVTGPIFSVGDIRTAPAVSLSVSAVLPGFDDLSKQVADLASAIRYGSPTTLILAIGAGPSGSSKPVGAAALGSLPGISDHCNGQPVASLLFPYNGTSVDAADLKASGTETIDGRTTTEALGKLLSERANAASDHQILLIGHADPTGDAVYNLSLSQRRAEAVRQAIVRADPSRTFAPTQAMGAMEWVTGGPIAGLGQELDTARRVDVFLCKKEEQVALQ